MITSASRKLTAAVKLPEKTITRQLTDNSTEGMFIVKASTFEVGPFKEPIKQQTYNTAT